MVARQTETKRYGDWMQTASGRQFWPLDPQPEDVYIEDIAHALSMLCRFNGHCMDYYSVAEHSCYVSDACPAQHKLWALLHDASEAYVGDVIRPIKPWLTGYKGIELRIMECVCLRFDIPLMCPPIVKETDGRILANELRDVMGPHPAPAEWQHTGSAIPGIHIANWSPRQARMEFMRRFQSLYHGG